MKDAIEAKLVGASLKAPIYTQIINIKPKYFANRQLGALYSAVDSHPSPDDASDWLPEARKHGYRGSANSMQAIADYCLLAKPNFFHMYANMIYKAYLRRQISYYGRKLSSLDGSYNVFEKLMHYSSLYENANSINEASEDAPFNQYHEDSSHDLSDGLLPNYKYLDKVLGRGLTGGTLMTIGAGTGVGKTTFSINIASNIMEDAHKRHLPLRVDYFSGEMTEAEILHCFISCRTGVSTYQMLNPHKRIKDKRLLSYTNKVDDDLEAQGLRMYTIRDLSQIKSTIRQHAIQRKPNTYLAIIDHVGLVHVDGPRANDPKNQRTADVCNDMKTLTTQLHIPIIMQSQINRRVTTRDSPELMLSDLSDSSAVEKDSDIVLLLYRDDKYNPTHRMIKVAKNRNAIYMKIPFLFDKGGVKFIEADHEVAEYIKHHRNFYNKD